MDTMEAWKGSAFGRCMANAVTVTARRLADAREVRLTAWELADGFLLGEMWENRPTENKALTHAFYHCEGWSVVARAWANEGRGAWENRHKVIAIILAESARKAENIPRQLVLMDVKRKPIR